MSSNVSENSTSGPWWRNLNRYQWMVFLLASLGWIFDCFDQQLFTMSRSITMRDLMPGSDMNQQNVYGGYATTAFILGWATGGLIFGVIGDTWGRAKTMALTIFVYAGFTGLSALSKDWVSFSAFRFLTGLGVGGEFAVGVALIAEAMPDRARASALGSLQALSAFGNILAAIMIRYTDVLGGWRNLYWVGAAPALLACACIFMLREPDKWLAWREQIRRNPTPQPSRLKSLLGNPRWRRHVGVGLGLAIAGVFGLWGVAFWSGELIDSTLLPMKSETRTVLQQVVASASREDHAARVGTLTPEQLRTYVNLVKYTIPAGGKFNPKTAAQEPAGPGQKSKMSALLAKALDSQQEKTLKSNAFILQQVGGFCGILVLSLIASRLGRRFALAVAMLAGMGGASFVFYHFSDKSQIYWLWPLLGFCTLMPFGGFAIYFPELFPTSLRSTGVSVCYNVGRYITAFGPLILPQLATQLHGKYELSGFRCAALIMCSAYLIGLVALIWAPETLGQPLPEEERAAAH
jgi:MFS family permease